MPQLSLLPCGPALARWASADRHYLGWSFIQRILSWLWDSRRKFMSAGAVDAGASFTSQATACILGRLGTRASPCSALVRHCQAQVTWYHWEKRGKGVIYIPDSWWVKQWVAKEVGSGQLAPGWWQQAWEGDPWAPASVFGRKAATDGVSVTAECCSKGWSAITTTDWALSHFLFHITPGKMENINETLEVNGAWSRLKCVKNFSQEICLFGPFLPIHRHNLPGWVLFIFPWLSLFLFNP